MFGMWTCPVDHYMVGRLGEPTHQNVNALALRSPLSFLAPVLERGMFEASLLGVAAMFTSAHVSARPARHHTPTPRTAALLLAGLCLTTLAPHAALAQQVSFDQGIELVTIGSPGNAGWVGPGSSNGRGRVDYEYRIGRYEVTTAQWVEFMNAAFDRPQSEWLPHIVIPLFWGAAGATPTVPGGRRWQVPAGNEMRPVGDVNWRMAAMYCNWLHNGRSNARESFLSGAYDVSTFVSVPGPFGPVPNDQRVRSPGARFFIPTWDEWLKAAHYDPQKPNPDGSVGGWWSVNNAGGQPHVYGPPNVLINGLPTTANAGWQSGQFGGLSPYGVPLGAYASQSPWGLKDVAGATTEWTETAVEAGAGALSRIFAGSYWGSSMQSTILDQVLPDPAGNVPWFGLDYNGLRVAAVVPTPGTFIVVLPLTVVGCIRRRKGNIK